MRTIFFLVRKEYLQIFRNRLMLFQIFFIPVVQLLVLSNAATFNIRNTRVHVVDLDRSPLSQSLLERFASSGRFIIARQSVSMDRANEDLLEREVSMIIQIPSGFERDLYRTRNAQVQLVLNAEEGAAAGVVQSYARKILSDYAAEITPAIEPSAVTVAMVSGEPLPVKGRPTIDVRTRGRYNPELSYKAYMVPGILVSLVTLISTMLTAQNIAREKEIGTLEQLNVTPVTRGQFIAGKLIPFWILALFMFTFGLVLARLVFDIPLRGSVLLVIGVAAIYLLVTLSIGLWISTVAETQQQAMFVTFFIMMLYLLMSGLFTPLDSMPGWVQAVAQINPVKHFVGIMRAVLVKGAGFAAIQTAVYVLVAYAAVVLTFAVRQYRKTHA